MFQIPRGTRDFTPEEMEKRRYVESHMRSTFTSFGYREIQTPMFENLELFTAKSGEGIIEEIYAFKDKGGRDLALRPELTAPVMRFYVEKLQMEPKPLKLFYFGSCFRYDRPQKGRYREFQQAGCELIGTNTTEAYAELIALAYLLLKNIGLTNINVNIGNLTILSAVFDRLGLSKDQRKHLIPLIDKSLFDDVQTVLSECGLEPKKAQDFVTFLQTSDKEKIKKFVKGDPVAENEFTNLEKMLDLLGSSFQIKNYQIKLSIVRGLDYYKGLVFEIEAPILGAEKQLCGGGAYELVPLFGGTDVPTVGFAIGFDRAILALETEKFSFPKKQLDAFVIPVNEEMIQKSLQLAQILRQNNVTVDVDLLRRGVGKALKYANTLNVKTVLLVGPKELETDSVTLRDMKTGNQELVKISDVLSKVKNM
ncbi:MAG: histidine--tRNA ligase [Euryarchaeota archaeon]|nr:histidine--tRNA ligase [Euryarchaeota archaeon]